MARNKPVLTIRYGSHAPSVKLGVMSTREMANPRDYIGDFRRQLPNLPTVCKCGQKILKTNPEKKCETCLWASEDSNVGS